MVPLTSFFGIAGSKSNGLLALGEALEHTRAHMLTWRCSIVARGRKQRFRAVNTWEVGKHEVRRLIGQFRREGLYTTLFTRCVQTVCKALQKVGLELFFADSARDGWTGGRTFLVLGFFGASG